MFFSYQPKKGALYSRPSMNEIQKYKNSKVKMSYTPVTNHSALNNYSYAEKPLLFPHWIVFQPLYAGY